MKKSLLKNIYIIYSILFLLLLPVVFYPYLAEGRSFVWNVDGISQHLPILLYYGRMLRGILMGKGFAMVDFTIGMGYDTITTLHYYVIGDPLALLSVFMNVQNGVLFYNGLILLRLYLMGISFLLFCRYWRLPLRGRIPGALIYVFCGYTFYSGVRHPYFLNPMIYLPLLLLGLEEVLRRRKPYLLIGMTFLCAISNFYFFFILSAISVIYVIVRYLVTFAGQEQHKLIGLIRIGFRTGGNYLFGTLLASVILLPVIYAFLQNGRMSSKPELLVSYFHYTLNYYQSVLQGVFASGVDPGYWVDLSFPTITAVSFVILFCNRRYKKLKYSCLLVLLGLAVPAFGYFMNGFAYVTNRWDFLLPFAVALTVTVTYEEIFSLNPWEKVLLILGVTGYGVLAFAFDSKKIVKLAFCFLLMTALLILLLQNRRNKNINLVQQGFFFLLLLVSIGFNGYAFYAREFNGYIEEFLTRKKVEKLLSGGEADMVAAIRDSGLYRVETHGDNIRNEALVMQFHDVSGYYSLMDGGITEFYKQLELLNQRSAYRFDNQDNRTILDALAGVKYFVTTVKRAVPFGYVLVDQIKSGGKTYYLFMNNYPLPIGYVYHEAMTEEEYSRLNALEKQNALLYEVVLETGNEFAEPAGQDVSSGIEQLDYQVKADGVVLGKNTIQVKKAEGQLLLSFVSRGKSETYLQISGLAIEKEALVMQTIHVQGENEKKKNLNIRNKYYNSYFGRVNFLANTGYSKSEKTWIRITFPEAMTFSYDAIKVYSLDMLQYKKQVQKLREEPLTNIKRNNNKLEGDVVLGRKGILLLSIPYSRGWKAYVDGTETALERGNIMYMALPLAEGNHHIVLKYRTPFLLEGFLISVLALLFLAGKLLIERKGGNHG